MKIFRMINKTDYLSRKKINTIVITTAVKFSVISPVFILVTGKPSH